ncbi:phage portal protein [Nocardia transvalensis]|uniref:phage portal protein n=1 Tax=Nocardia transvalensis TaxID=37333 RepID=UPI001895015C|nr:phage portal protein [Nocardia transvalensis]MBF6333331.1 phage portal protein [Nocardia transvalensis]
MLPDTDIPWPPPPFDRAHKQMAIWDAWYANDTDRLSDIYRRYPAYRPAQFAGGLVGRIVRFFWGRPDPQAVTRLHAPLASDIARGSADMVFAQPPRFVIGDGDARGDRAAAQARLELLLGGADTAATLLEAGELASVLGGVYLRAWWDRSVGDHVVLGHMPADAAVPYWHYGRLVAVTFWQVVAEDTRAGVVWRHLEHHAPGRIEHGLYVGGRDRLGRRRPLAEHPATEWAAPLVDSRSAIPTGITDLTARYVPNMKPNRAWRRTPGLASLGRSDFDGQEKFLDALDETYSAWMRDVELAKARLFVDRQVTQSRGPGAGAVFDPDQAIFTPLPGGSLGSLKDGQPPIIPQQFAIRWQEHRETALELTGVILRGAGHSASTFGDDRIAGTLTATEVNARDRLSERTREKKINYWKAELTPFARVITELDRVHFGSAIELKAHPEVRWPVRTQQPPLETANRLAVLKTADLISTEQAVRERNPNWSGDDVNDEVARIEAEVQQRAREESARPFRPADITR